MTAAFVTHLSSISYKKSTKSSDSYTDFLWKSSPFPAPFPVFTKVLIIHQFLNG